MLVGCNPSGWSDGTGGNGSGQGNGDNNGDATEPTQPVSGWWKPQPLTTWQWQLKGTINTSYVVQAYDIDLFDSPIELIQEIQATGKRVICYFSADSYEGWREDAGEFAGADRGNPLDGWAGERWLDIRSENVHRVMQARLDVAVDKGCDAVEPDNVDGYTNDPGFPLSAQNQIDFNRMLAWEAHARNLAIGLKNDLDQIEELVNYFDFAVNEQCFEYEECALLNPFISQNKAVFSAEYQQKLVDNASERADLCSQANSLQLSTLVLPLDLDDSFRYDCQ